MHVQAHAVAAPTVSDGGDDDQLVLHDEVADASLFAGRLVARVSLDVEFEGVSEGQADEEEQAAQSPEQHLHGGRIGAEGVWRERRLSCRALSETQT